jgi:hypothetical protein
LALAYATTANAYLTQGIIMEEFSPTGTLECTQGKIISRSVGYEITCHRCGDEGLWHYYVSHGKKRASTLWPPVKSAVAGEIRRISRAKRTTGTRKKIYKD